MPIPFYNVQFISFHAYFKAQKVADALCVNVTFVTKFTYLECMILLIEYLLFKFGSVHT